MTAATSVAAPSLTWILIAVGLLALSCRGAWLGWRRGARDFETAAKCLAWPIAVTLALLFAGWGWPTVRWLGLVVAAQLTLVALTPAGVSRRPMAWIGHLASGAGLLLTVMAGRPTIAAGLCVVAGLAFLAVHAHLRQSSHRPSIAAWDPALFALIALGLGALSIAYSAQAAHVAPKGLLVVCDVIAWTCAGAAAIILCAPPFPAFLTRWNGIGPTITAHGIAAVAVLNILFLALAFVAGIGLRILLLVLFAWQMLVIGLEYRTVHHAISRRRRHQRRLVDLDAAHSAKMTERRARREAVTVIIPARDEGAVLPGSLAHNVAIDHPLRFLIVASTHSQDDTLAVAHDFARRHPDRVRVLESDVGSKAAELNLAWRHVTTPHVLVLDADETIDRESLERAVALLAAEPGVGIVQGRKVSRAPHEGFLARFVSAERRYSTGMDQVMHSEVLGSSHFAGSAALLRREAIDEVGGWTERTLTEDIELSLRVHLHGKWRILYCPEVVVRESDPATAIDLLKQRTRWARGWAQCVPLFLPQIVRHRRRLGLKRAFGLGLLLVVTLSALWTTFVPATLLMRLAGFSPLLPAVVTLAVTLLLLPSRLLAYGYAAWRDPVIPMRMTPRNILELAWHAYLWILIGWIVQLHALHLELTAAPRAWSVTAKRAPQLAAVVQD